MIAFAALLLLAAGADPGPEELAPVRITVRAIAASKSAADVDARLAPIAHDLANFGNDFRFQSYRLVAGQSFDLGWNGSAEMELPGSRSVRLTPKHMGPDGRVKVHLELFGEHPEHRSSLMTDFSVPRGGTILVGGLRLDPKAAPGEGDVLLIAVTTERVPDADAQRGDVRATVRPRPELQLLPPTVPPDPVQPMRRR